MKCFVLILLIVVSVSAQTPDELQKAIGELQKEVKGTKVELQSLRLEEAQKNALEKERRVMRTRWRLQAQERSAALARRQARELKAQPTEQPEEVTCLHGLLETDLIQKEMVPTLSLADEEKSKALLVQERDYLVEKIRRQNRSNSCRFLGFGCITIKPKVQK